MVSSAAYSLGNLKVYKMLQVSCLALTYDYDIEVNLSYQQKDHEAFFEIAAEPELLTVTICIQAFQE